ncbi:hypothetical protein NsoK4_04670 [Nitrosopumilus sp. K4]|uniref:hypothetical protein n=1 Tax=Nitrosopumilus sp. K4 TaxID=2795383 RepID=UPI001BA70D31|nr:hypothetical protein [Nitrosopumilus sp. K4]QUC65534.1 hypothetical protein NsoK4_04670 [Nitrosopumilus sp. K4]
MNFLSKKILEYHKKKLAEAQDNLKYHISRKEQLKDIPENSIESKNQEKMIKIWSNNVEKIKKEIKKIKEKN